LLLKSTFNSFLFLIEPIFKTISPWENAIRVKIFLLDIPEDIQYSVAFVGSNLKNLDLVKLLVVMVEESIGKVHCHYVMHLLESFSVVDSGLFFLRRFLNNHGLLLLIVLVYFLVVVL
jgi:hypothetical protein